MHCPYLYACSTLFLENTELGSCCRLRTSHSKFRPLGVLGKKWKRLLKRPPAYRLVDESGIGEFLDFALIAFQKPRERALIFHRFASVLYLVLGKTELVLRCPLRTSHSKFRPLPVFGKRWRGLLKRPRCIALWVSRESARSSTLHLLHFQSLARTKNITCNSTLSIFQQQKKINVELQVMFLV